MPSSCCVKGCFNKQTFYGYSMFGFPNDTEMRNQWLEALGPDCSAKSHHRVCEVHFEPELVHFVGSRKELKKNAVPTLFCNCIDTKLLNSTQMPTGKSEMKSKKQNSSGITTLDHSYSQSLPVLKTSVKKEDGCSNNQDPAVYFVKRKSFKHSPGCNIMRGPLKNTLKSRDSIASDGGITYREFLSSSPRMITPPLVQAPLKKNTLKSKSLVTRNSGVIHRVLLTNSLKGPPQIISSMKNVTKKENSDDCNLKLQLKSALDENAKLKEELSMLKAGLVVPVSMLPSSEVKFVKLEKIT